MRLSNKLLVAEMGGSVGVFTFAAARGLLFWECRVV